MAYSEKELLIWRIRDLEEWIEKHSSTFIKGKFGFGFVNDGDIFITRDGSKYKYDTDLHNPRNDDFITDVMKGWFLYTEGNVFKNIPTLRQFYPPQMNEIIIYKRKELATAPAVVYDFVFACKLPKKGYRRAIAELAELKEKLNQIDNL